MRMERPLLWSYGSEKKLELPVKTFTFRLKREKMDSMNLKHQSKSINVNTSINTFIINIKNNTTNNFLFTTFEDLDTIAHVTHVLRFFQ